MTLDLRSNICIKINTLKVDKNLYKDTKKTRKNQENMGVCFCILDGNKDQLIGSFGLFEKSNCH